MKILSQCDNYIKFYCRFVKNGSILTNRYLSIINTLFLGDELLDIVGKGFQKQHFRVDLSILPLCNDSFFA
jgi:hypothetical protein